MRRFIHLPFFLLSFFLVSAAALADGPADNLADKVRPVPPPGNVIAAADRAELETGVAALGREIDLLRATAKPDQVKYLPDIQIYYNAVRYPLVYNELLDVKAARQALADGMARVQSLKNNQAPWALLGGPRGYISRIDGSVQPYILGVPKNFGDDGRKVKYRIDFSCHGRGENLTELNFIRGGVPKPADKLEVNLYGRYCCANKFAGEIDLLECLDSLKKQYPLDENRIVITGFSMGGAACWQFAVHYTDLFAAAQPGAGFAETKEFLRVFQNEPVSPPWYEQKLWHWYDCTDYAANLANLYTVAYSGEIDKQKQAADIMEAAMAKEGLKLIHLIGPKTAHSFHKETKQEVDKLIDEAVAKGRDPVPAKIRFTTYSLRYNRMYWVTIDGMEKEWARADVDAEIKNGKTVITTKNVTALTLSFPTGLVPQQLRNLKGTTVTIDGEVTQLSLMDERQNGKHFLMRLDGHWFPAFNLGQQLNPGESPAITPSSKRHGLQGPIDDAFMDSFLIVKPTGKPLNEKAGQWANSEAEHAIVHWRKQFRGEARVKNDTDITTDDIAAHNLICFGDPSNNAIIAKTIAKLPMKWTADQLSIGAANYPAGHHMPALIYPNPLNPSKYIVLNSGFTFREYDYLNNARQVPKLPDYAIIDIDSPITPRAPGKVVLGGFFGENWQVLPDHGEK